MRDTSCSEQVPPDNCYANGHAQLCAHHHTHTNPVEKKSLIKWRPAPHKKARRREDEQRERAKDSEVVYSIIYIDLNKRYPSSNSASIALISYEYWVSYSNRLKDVVHTAE